SSNWSVHQSPVDAARTSQTPPLQDSDLNENRHRRAAARAERSPKAPVLTARANRLPDSFWTHVSVGCYPYDGLAMRAVNSDLVERNVPILKIALVEYNENVGANAPRVVS